MRQHAHGAGDRDAHHDGTEGDDLRTTRLTTRRLCDGAGEDHEDHEHREVKRPRARLGQDVWIPELRRPARSDDGHEAGEEHDRPSGSRDPADRPRPAAVALIGHT